MEDGKKGLRLEDCGEVLTMDELRRVLKIGRNTAYDLLRQGRMRHVKVGNAFRVPRGAVEEFLRGGE